MYKCPFNYIGSKSSLLSTIIPMLDCYKDYYLVDLFAGGFSVGANCNNLNLVYNDINNDMTNLVEYIYSTEINKLIRDIENTIFEYGLSKDNSNSYNKLRNDFNKTKDSLLFCILIFFSFNHQIRYNQNHQYNVPFGKNKSYYNDKIKKNLINFSELIKTKNIIFYSKHFSEILLNEKNKYIYYVDPPYIITTGSYNDGNRGISSWNETDEIKLYEYLDMLDKLGSKFVLSNMLRRGDITNKILKKWMGNYEVVFVNTEYKNYHRNRVECIEVIVKNF